LLWGNIGKDIMLGTIHPEQKEILESTDKLFRECGIIPEVPSQVRHWLWMHNVGTAPFGAALAKYRDMTKYLDDKELVKTTFRACRECCTICRARGVKLKQFPESKMYNFPLFLLYPMFKKNFTKNPVMQRYTAHAVNDIDEMSMNFEEMYHTGLNLKIQMPNMTALHDVLISSKKNH